MGWMLWTSIAVLGWLAWAGLSHWLLRNPRGDAPSGLVYRFLQLYSRLLHRLRVVGRQHIPQERGPAIGTKVGPLLVVCNHTAGIDPLLVQASCPFFIRWMMAQDMKWQGLSDIWSYFELIFVDRTKPDVRSLREAVRALRVGHVVGVFPEGRIAKPRGSLLPFQQGVGMMVAMSGARVLPILIRGTPDSPSAWGSLWRSSKSELDVGAPMAFDKDANAQAITSAIEAWFRGRMAGEQVS